ncbi:MAG: 2-isopropylmalate synthase [Alphaproteobacteria bacterium GM202ARS2]|nr:2-isopropylmalate synthase [Alphaproteobacteria bacterium GM202ARS2]
MNTKTARKQASIVIFDTTLRDGEQSPGASMTLEEKHKVALLLEAMHVDIIEAGFPAASKGDFQAVKRIAQSVKNSTVCGLARAHDSDIRAAGEALAAAKRKRIHTFISTSPLHMKYKLRMTPEDVYDAVIHSVTLARNLTDDVEWSPEDATRSEHDFLCRCIEAAIKAGATTINIPDTVGYSTPSEFSALIRMIRENVRGADKAVFSCHCHNDLGLAVANSLAAVDAGARQIECTINGIGERAGNAALEEVVMACVTRNDTLPYRTAIDTTYLTRASHLVSTVTGFSVQPNKAIVGQNAFSHEAGIHQDGMLKHSNTYEIMTPESVGRHQSVIVLGKHSGRHAFVNKLHELGFDAITPAHIEEAFKRFKDLADYKKDIFEEDILALVDETVTRRQQQRQLLSLHIQYQDDKGYTVRVAIKDNEQEKSAQATSQGVIDGLFKAIHTLIPHQASLQLYQVKAISGGTDAQAEVTVRLQQDGVEVVGQSAHTDTVHASARAYIHALNKLASVDSARLTQKTSPIGAVGGI